MYVQPERNAVFVDEVDVAREPLHLQVGRGRTCPVGLDVPVHFKIRAHGADLFSQAFLESSRRSIQQLPGGAVESRDLRLALREFGGFHRRNLVADRHRRAPALRDQGLAHVVHDVDVEVGQRADGAIRPVVGQLA